jgi:hypothetical protein
MALITAANLHDLVNFAMFCEIALKLKRNLPTERKLRQKEKTIILFG